MPKRPSLEAALPQDRLIHLLAREMDWADVASFAVPGDAEETKRHRESLRLIRDEGVLPNHQLLPLRNLEDGSWYGTPPDGGDRRMRLQTVFACATLLRIAGEADFPATIIWDSHLIFALLRLDDLELDYWSECEALLSWFVHQWAASTHISLRGTAERIMLLAGWLFAAVKAGQADALLSEITDGILAIDAAEPVYWPERRWPAGIKQATYPHEAWLQLGERLSAASRQIADDKLRTSVELIGAMLAGTD